MIDHTLLLHRVVGASRIEKIALGLMAPMTQGQLTMHMADGRRITLGDGIDPLRATMHVHDAALFTRCLLFGDIGIGESFTAGEWTSPNLTNVIKWAVLNIGHAPFMSGSTRSRALAGVLRSVNRIGHLLRDNSIAGSKRNIAAHYDLSEAFFRCFLDETLTYSAADFSTGAVTLADAQRAKYDRLAQAMHIGPSDHVLEIGGGWGGGALHLASHYGCRVTTVTVSAQQLATMQRRISEAGLADRIDAQFCDYREVQGQFDKIFSIEMLEAVGHDHLPSFFATCERVLKPDGIVGAQAILCPDSRYAELRRGVDWTQKHIFPGSLLLSIHALTAAAGHSDLSLHSLFDLGLSYATTLSRWRQNFFAQLPAIRQTGFTDELIRTWDYYFSYCEAAFATRNITVAQMIFSRPNNAKL